MDFRAIAMGLAFSAMWSSAFTSARMIVMDAPPLTALTIRFLISGLIGIGIALLLGQNARLSRACAQAFLGPPLSWDHVCLAAWTVSV
jgi:drug/metabolite transporter (DMT)-like permease